MSDVSLFKLPNVSIKHLLTLSIKTFLWRPYQDSPFIRLTDMHLLIPTLTTLISSLSSLSMVWLLSFWQFKNYYNEMQKLALAISRCSSVSRQTCSAALHKVCPPTKGKFPMQISLISGADLRTRTASLTRSTSHGASPKMTADFRSQDTGSRCLTSRPTTG